MLPSIEVAAKIADVLEVSLDYLAGNSKKAAVDKKTMKLFMISKTSNLPLKTNLFSWPTLLSETLKQVRLTLIKKATSFYNLMASDYFSIFLK